MRTCYEDCAKPMHNFTSPLAKEDIPYPLFNAICKTALPLKCYSAQVIRRSEIPFNIQIPFTLHSFVQSI